MATVDWPARWQINTDWTDSANVSIVVGKTEIGPAITRKRSHNIMHKLKVNVLLDWEQVGTTLYADCLPTFMARIEGGAQPFNFRSPVDSIIHTTYLDCSNGQPYQLKRNDNSTYTVTFTLMYYDLGAF